MPLIGSITCTDCDRKFSVSQNNLSNNDINFIQCFTTTNFLQKNNYRTETNYKISRIVDIKFDFTSFFSQNFDLDDTELKNLLDEAYSYKGPKDKENKSEIFKVRVWEMLGNVN